MIRKIILSLIAILMINAGFATTTISYDYGIDGCLRAETTTFTEFMPKTDFAVPLIGKQKLISRDPCFDRVEIVRSNDLFRYSNQIRIQNNYDYKACTYVNGELICETKNIFGRNEVDVNAKNNIRTYTNTTSGFQGQCCNIYSQQRN